ncbi:MAG: His/Gly/Thr/Pro-type tRNA ligase C-terminal domain-containing protein [Candidatus Nanoarchaeia archaeon]|jgi:prolyl-tRNA synthetase|nr:His/Gly/Thr/Pro-type tRNA ligase C-terminal domain-containing protein [Candidatus Nanoarchaeia archaeon]|tara:strand:+ start:15950 stop:17395 length:1446 start_codon:yes stop_codon:yes gene_type:complete
MKKESEQPEALTAKKDKNFSEWYNQVIAISGLIDKRYNVKGMFVWLNYGYELILNLKNYWDQIFKETGLKELYFPLIVPLEYAEMNDGWFKGFREQAFWVRGSDEKKATHILRPTGEPAMYPMFALWTRAYTDLPLRIYETVSSFRYETKHTRPLVRDREITVWFEIHTAHSTREEAEKEGGLHQKFYDLIWKKIAVPRIRVEKPEWECFPGAIGAVEDYTIMPNGKAMENGSINYLGQAYSKKFNIKFKDKDGKEKYAWQMCTGNGARFLVAALAAHGDDRGLVIPPEIAVIQLIIIPIYSTKDKSKVLKKANEIYDRLKKENIKVEIDLREDRPGSKFYDWEIKGVPIRLEIGPKDLKNKSVMLVRRDNGKKESIKETQLVKKVDGLLEEIQRNIYKKARKEFNDKIVFTNKLNEVNKLLDQGKVIKCFWDGEGKSYDKIKALGEGVDPFGVDIENKKQGRCIVSGKKTNKVLCISNTY